MLATKTMFSAIPICPVVVEPRNRTAKLIRPVAKVATTRSTTRPSHCCRHKSIYAGCCDLSRDFTFTPLTCFTQPNARIVSRPSSYLRSMNCQIQNRSGLIPFRENLSIERTEIPDREVAIVLMYASRFFAAHK